MTLKYFYIPKKVNNVYLSHPLYRHYFLTAILGFILLTGYILFAAGGIMLYNRMGVLGFIQLHEGGWNLMFLASFILTMFLCLAWIFHRVCLIPMGLMERFGYYRSKCLKINDKGLLISYLFQRKQDLIPWEKITRIYKNGRYFKFRQDNGETISVLFDLAVYPLFLKDYKNRLKDPEIFSQEPVAYLTFHTHNRQDGSISALRVLFGVMIVLLFTLWLFLVGPYFLVMSVALIMLSGIIHCIVFGVTIRLPGDDQKTEVYLFGRKILTCTEKMEKEPGIQRYIAQKIAALLETYHFLSKTKKKPVLKECGVVFPVLLLLKYIKALFRKPVERLDREKEGILPCGYLKKTSLTVVICLLMMVVVPVLFLRNPYGGGKGTEDDPYHIKTAEHLNNVRNNNLAHFVQTADIDLIEYSEGMGWEPIDFIVDEIKYDGSGYAIKNLTINKPDTDGIGLFKSLSGTLENITLENVNVYGNGKVGGLVGDTYKGIIINCHVQGNIKGENFATGGLVGLLNGGEIALSSARINVSGNSNVGGLVGVTSLFSGIISDSFVHGEVSGEEKIGGLVGHNYLGKTLIERSYSTAKVTGEKDTGGLVGKHKDGTIESSYYDMETSGQSDEGKGTPKTTAEMKHKATFEGWDFEEIWDIVENESYPFLRGVGNWKESSADK